MEVRRSGGGVGTCKSLPQEPWRSGDAPQACCLFASRALEMRCSRVASLPQKRYGALLFVVVGISRFRSSRLFAPKRFASPVANYPLCCQPPCVIRGTLLTLAR